MGYYSPKEIASSFSESGIYKANLSFSKFAVLAFLGGAFIAFGGLLTVVVAGAMPGVMSSNPGMIKFIAGALFPVGLIMVSVAGADLFTSDCAAMVQPCMQKKISFAAVLKVWVLSYLFNFIGAQFVAYFLASYVDIVPHTTYLSSLAHSKVSHTFDVVFFKAIGANWLVCLGTWMGFAAKDITGKAIGIWIPVMTFVTIGFEHSIANMFFIPLAIYTGADITWTTFIVANLIPATLGNIVGGALFVGAAYWFVYLRKK